MLRQQSLFPLLLAPVAAGRVCAVLCFALLWLCEPTLPPSSTSSSSSNLATLAKKTTFMDKAMHPLPYTHTHSPSRSFLWLLDIHAHKTLSFIPSAPAPVPAPVHDDQPHLVSIYTRLLAADVIHFFCHPSPRSCELL